MSALTLTCPPPRGSFDFISQLNVNVTKLLNATNDPLLGNRLVSQMDTAQQDKKTIDLDQ